MKQHFSIINSRYLLFCFGVALILNSKPVSAQDMNIVAQHPAYIHALVDLRAARWLLKTKGGGSWEQTAEERNALAQIDAAMSDIREAKIDDNKRQENHIQLDDMADHAGRLREALDFLKKARTDLAQGEDDQFGHQLRARVYSKIDAAIGSVRKAVHS